MLLQPITTKSNRNNSLVSQSPLPPTEMPILRAELWSAMIKLYQLGVTRKGWMLAFAKPSPKVQIILLHAATIASSIMLITAVLTLTSDRHVRNNSYEKRKLKGCPSGASGKLRPMLRHVHISGNMDSQTLRAADIPYGRPCE